MVIPAVLAYLGLRDVTATLLKILRWPIMLVIIGFALAVLYRYGPSRSKPQWRWISWGSAFAAVVWLGFSILFSWYAGNFGHYNEAYGSLGAVIGFMLWLWLSIVVILVGAELDAEMEHQTVRDTTTGRPRAYGRAWRQNGGHSRCCPELTKPLREHLSHAALRQRTVLIACPFPGRSAIPRILGHCWEPTECEQKGRGRCRSGLLGGFRGSAGPEPR